MTMPELALRFILQHPAVSTVIPGMRKLRHVEAEPGGERRPGRCRAPLMDELRRHRWDRWIDIPSDGCEWPYGLWYTDLLPEDPKEPAVKEGIHPKYHEIEARCACGATWKTRSTKPELHLEICNNCHPFFTGRQKLIDTEGRVERFTKRFGVQTSESRKAAAKTKKTEKTAAAAK